MSSGVVGFSAWSHDGKTLYYIDGSGSVMAVPVESQSPFKAGPAKKLYSSSGGPISEVAASPEGKLLVLVPPGNQPVTPASLVVNWSAELNK
jgi:hypothetical protein